MEIHEHGRSLRESRREAVLVGGPKEGDCRGKVDGLWKRERTINGRESQNQGKYQKKVTMNLQVYVLYAALSVLRVARLLPLLQGGCRR